jgi:molecular chaperone DnaK
VKRTTIDFGIDLGTTNSAIAVFTGSRGEATKIVKNTRDGTDADITPSAVYINKKGVLRVGRRAKDRLEDEDQDVAIEFKRQMGTDHVYVFKSSCQSRKPEDLSAEILKSLRGDVEQRTGEVVESAVITVPAAFELHQCDATRKAAELAGFKQSPLLQEPVAAALAYGFDVDNRKTYWLVCDFGGGTFDAAIIKSEEGTIQVVDHGGDNFLGGSNIDWAIVEKLVAPRAAKDFKLTDFVRSNAKWRRAFLKLKRNAEIAKIDLSRNEKTALETCKLDDDRGDEIEFECELTRNEVVNVAEPFILRVTGIAKEVLKRKKLGTYAIEKVILVGGPTLAPYFREILVAQLGISLDHTVDPLTVVACGAAVFAGTQRLESPAVVSATDGEYRLELAKSFRAVGLDSAPMIGGKVSSERARDFTGFTLELANTKTQWRSGKVPLQADGVFMANLHAEKGERNTYVIELWDANGRKQKIKRDTVHYTIGVGGDVEQPLIHSMGIALANNEYDRLFEKGRGLPLKTTRDYRTAHAIRQGQTGELIKIPIVEGEYDLADRNPHIDDLVIDARNIRRDLPAGSEVEITLRMDESRIVTASAYVPLLDEEFSKKIELRHKSADAQFLREDFDKEVARFEIVKSQAESARGETAEEMVQQVEDSPLMRQVEELLAAGKADSGAAAECEKRLLELKLELDKAANAVEWPALKSEARGWLNWLQKVADQNGTEKQKQRANEFAAELEKITRERNADRLRKLMERIGRLYFEIVSTLPDWWMYQFQRAEKEQHKMIDPERAARLIGQGREYVSKNNLIGLQNVVRQLWDLLPAEIAEAAKRGYDAGLIR